MDTAHITRGEPGKQTKERDTKKSVKMSRCTRGLDPCGQECVVFKCSWNAEPAGLFHLRSPVPDYSFKIISICRQNKERYIRDYFVVITAHPPVHSCHSKLKTTQWIPLRARHKRQKLTKTRELNVDVSLKYWWINDKKDETKIKTGNTR